MVTHRIAGLAVMSIMIVGCLAFLALYGLCLAPSTGLVEDDWVEPGSDHTPKMLFQTVLSDYTPEMLFRTVLMDPIPSGVRDIQGCGFTWLGYAVYLRFAATDAGLDAIIAQASWQEVSAALVLPAECESLKDTWVPETVADKDCYRIEAAKNAWTHDGISYLVADRSTSTAHFSGSGA